MVNYKMSKELKKLVKDCIVAGTNKPFYKKNTINKAWFVYNLIQNAKKGDCVDGIIDDIVKLEKMVKIDNKKGMPDSNVSKKATDKKVTIDDVTKQLKKELEGQYLMYKTNFNCLSCKSIEHYLYISNIKCNLSVELIVVVLECRYYSFFKQIPSITYQSNYNLNFNLQEIDHKGFKILTKEEWKLKVGEMNKEITHV